MPSITRGKFDNPDDPGEISHFQALTSALSATVGLGNIAGVAVGRNWRTRRGFLDDHLGSLWHVVEVPRMCTSRRSTERLTTTARFMAAQCTISKWDSRSEAYHHSWPRPSALYSLSSASAARSVAAICSKPIKPGASRRPHWRVVSGWSSTAMRACTLES